jgi:hypothetical protein
MIRTYRTFAPMEQQRTQATLYREALAEKRDEQAQQRIPRSEKSWGTEQQRLGSWQTGVGNFRPSGVGNMYHSGVGLPTQANRFREDYDR